MEIKTVDYRALTLIGLEEQVTPGGAKIPTLWGALSGRQHEIPGLARNGLSFGVSSAMNADGSFTYLAAMEGSGEPPAGMVRRTYPAATYAVFGCTMTTIPEVFGRIYAEWLPQAGLQSAGDYNLEVYGPDFDPDRPEAVFEIYVPVAAV